MMKLCFRFALGLAVTVAAPGLARAQTPPAPAVAATNGTGPRIQFNTENYEAGTNIAGDVIRYTFLVTNTGDETLVLSNVKPSCGCTTVGGALPSATTSGGGTVPASTATWTHEIAPSQVGIIPIQIATDNLRGPIHKTVAVTSNDRTRPNITLQISATVWMPVEITPVNASFNLMPDATNGGANTQIIRIFNRTATPLTLSSPVSSTNAFSAVLKTNEPGKEFELIISASLPDRLSPSLSMTFLQGEILVRSSDTNKNPLKIPVYETIYPEITIVPPSPLPPGPLAQANTSHAIVRDNIASLQLSDPVVNVPGVTASINVIQTNRQYSIFAVFPKGFEAQPGQNIVLSVKTDNPHFPTLTIPVPSMRGPIRGPVTPAPVRTRLLPPAPRRMVPAAGTATNAPVNPP